VNEVETKYNISAAIFSGPVKYQQTDELYWTITLNIKEQ
jgi:hypothetical protein